MQFRTITGNFCVSALCKKHDYEWNCRELLDHYVNHFEERSLDNAAAIKKPSAAPALHLLEGALRSIRTVKCCVGYIMVSFDNLEHP